MRRRRSLAFDGDPGNEQLGERVAAAQRTDHVVNRLAPRRGDQRDALREARQRTLALRPHQALALELAGERRDLQPQVALPRGREARTWNCIRPLGTYAEKWPVSSTSIPQRSSTPLAS